MLATLSVRNFRSIHDLTVGFGFAEKKAPPGYRESDLVYFLEPVRKTRIVPVLAMYGSNASGKSNVLMALAALRECAISGMQGRFHPDKMHPEWTSTSFEVTLYVGNRCCCYSIEYDRDSFLRETLGVDGTVLYSIGRDGLTFGGIVTRAYSEERLEEIYRVECCTPKKGQIFSFLSVLGRHYPGLSSLVHDVYEYFRDQVVVLRDNSVHLSRGLDMLTSALQKNGDRDPMASAFSRITELLESLDIHISRMELNRNSVQLNHDPTDTNYIDVEPRFLSELTSFEKDGGHIVLNSDRIKSFHLDEDGKEVEFDFMSEESSGTQIVAGLLGVFLAVLENGGIVAVDELDRSLHPLLLIEIVRLFKAKRYNVHGAQLFFTVHNTDILDADLLRVSEVGILSKTQSDGSEITRISDFEGIGNVENFRRQYLTGRFSGIPYPYI